jgi:hypothetical protein
MIPIQNQQVLEADGDYAFGAMVQGRECIVEWCVTAGTATVTPGYVNLAGGFSPARTLDGELPVFGAEGGGCVVEVPNSCQLALKVEGAADLLMIVCQTLVPN